MDSTFNSTARAFLWKNYRSIRYNWLKSLLLIVLPILLCTLQVLTLVSKPNPTPTTIFSPNYMEDIDTNFPQTIGDKLLFTPNNTVTWNLMEDVRTRMNIFAERLMAFQTESDMEKYIYDQRREIYNHFFAVTFPADIEDISKITVLNYTIQLISNAFKTEITHYNDIYKATASASDAYIESGFIALQNSIDRTYAEMKTGDSNQRSVEISFEKFPANARDRSRLIGISYLGYTMVTLYSFTLLCMVLVPMVEEKESGFMEYMKIATSHSYLNHLIYYFINLIIGLIILISSCLVAQQTGIVDHVPFEWLSLLILLYAMSAIAFTYMISVNFNTAHYAKVVGFLYYMIPFLCLSYSDSLQFIMPFFSSCVFLNALHVFDIIGSRGLVFSSEYLFENQGNNYSIATSYWLLIAETVAYLILYYYLKSAFPGNFGTPNYFPFIPACFRKKVPNSESNQALNYSNQPEIAVELQNLSKTFKGCKIPAVNNISMSIQKNEITVLLGHNGAGKTTAMSMIIGILPKSNGSIWVDGSDDIDVYRRKIGYCPQHNVLLPYLTCAEHLWFYGTLRGLNRKQIKVDKSQLLEKLGLTDKSNEYVKNLSGGMKRRLCLGNAIVGRTSIAILDEPSSGLDPESRRELWNILLDLRKNHAILLTTHYMEEAEILGDKIAIISNGTLLCYDKSLKLKKQYTKGYTLKLLKDPNMFKEREILDSIRNIIGEEPEMKKNAKNQLNIILPYRHQSKYPEVLKILEVNQKMFGIQSISITNSSLEDVFLNCSPQRYDEIDSTLERLGSHTINIDSNTSNDGFQRKRKCNRIFLIIPQIFAIIYKKLLYIRSNVVYTSLLFFLPVIGIVVSLLSINSKLNDSTTRSSIRNLHIGNTINSELLIQMNDTIPNFKEYKNTLEMLAKRENVNLIYWNPSQIEPTIEDALLAMEMKDIIHYYNEIPAAIEFSKDSNNWNIRILYSGNIPHSSSEAYNFVSNFLLATQMNDDSFRIQTTISPVNRFKTNVTNYDLNIYIMIVPMTMFFYLLYYVSLPFMEERSQFKKLQAIDPKIYWHSSYLFDMIVHALFCFVLIGLHILLDYNNIFASMKWDLYIIYLFYGLSYIPMTYISSILFESMSGLYSFLAYMFIGMYITASILSVSIDSINKYEDLIYILSFFPDYAFKHRLSSLFLIYTERTNNKFTEPHKSRRELTTNDYTEPIDNFNVSSFAIQTLFYAAVLLVFLVYFVENMGRREKCKSFFSRIIRRVKKTEPEDQRDELLDEDVVQERTATYKLRKGKHCNDYPIVVVDVTKRYDEVDAVNAISFSSGKGECLGLIGLNGAGKTSTYKMMTADLTITKGEILFYGKPIQPNQLSESPYLMGYCPQVDALNEHMTAFETLKYIGWIRGIPFKNLESEVNKWLRQTDLLDYKDIQVKYYSGGTKRKLNTAMAMISNPSIAFLDEPTTGVDPASRRFLWSCIQELQSRDKNIVLTSHSMDECEELCDRLVIMDRGKIGCIGPIQKLRNKYGQGFTITFLIKPYSDSSRLKQLKEEFSSKFINETASLDRGNQHRNSIEEYGGTIKFTIQKPNLKSSKIFEQVRLCQDRFADIVEDVSVNETTLEDIFLSFAKKSKERHHTV